MDISTVNPALLYQSGIKIVPVCAEPFAIEVTSPVEKVLFPVVVDRDADEFAFTAAPHSEILAIADPAEKPFNVIPPSPKAVALMPPAVKTCVKLNCIVDGSMLIVPPEPL